MDVKAKIDEVVAKVKNDPKFMEDFKKDPIKTVESVIGVDLPDDTVKQIVAGVKGKITVDNASNLLGSIKNMMK